jgi:hypothetical protein
MPDNMTIGYLEKQVNFPERFRQLCLKYCESDFMNVRKFGKKEMLAIFNELGYGVKNFANDKIDVEKHLAGKCSYEYYFEFNGFDPHGIHIY